MTFCWGANHIGLMDVREGCVVGGQHDDTLTGGPGIDVCLGGLGTDTFVGYETEIQ